MPVWVALTCLPDWRWGLQRQDTPWYRTMRLFRQSAAGNWEGVFERITAEVKKLLPSARTATANPITAEIAAGGPGPAAPVAKPIIVEVAAGELIDKITILQIKSERMTDAAKRTNVQLELTALQAVLARLPQSAERIQALTGELRAVNEALWEIEDAIRLCERNQDFGARFIELARSVYQQNDRRATLKRQINDLPGSKLVEENNIPLSASASSRLCLGSRTRKSSDL